MDKAPFFLTKSPKTGKSAQENALIPKDKGVCAYFFLSKNVPKNTAANTKMMAGPVAMPL